MANPSGNHQEQQGHAPNSFNGVNSAGNPNNGNSAPENSGPMKHNPGISVDWTPDEQLTMEECLAKYASDSPVIRYAKIAMQLHDKTVRDVALRCRWMSKKENSKRRKEEHNVSRKSKDKKEKVSDPSAKLSHLAARPNVPPYAMPMVPVDGDDGISCKAIGGATGQLLEQNADAFNQISSNLANFQLQDNINLFCQARHNISSILNSLSDSPDVMKQMPILPVKLNEDLANSILGHSNISMK